MTRNKTYNENIRERASHLLGHYRIFTLNLRKDPLLSGIVLMLGQ